MWRQSARVPGAWPPNIDFFDFCEQKDSFDSFYIDHDLLELDSLSFITDKEVHQLAQRASNAVKFNLAYSNCSSTSIQHLAEAKLPLSTLTIPGDLAGADGIAFQSLQNFPLTKLVIIGDNMPVLAHLVCLPKLEELDIKPRGSFHVATNQAFSRFLRTLQSSQKLRCLRLPLMNEGIDVRLLGTFPLRNLELMMRTPFLTTADAFEYADEENEDPGEEEDEEDEKLALFKTLSRMRTLEQLELRVWEEGYWGNIYFPERLYRNHFTLPLLLKLEFQCFRLTPPMLLYIAKGAPLLTHLNLTYATHHRSSWRCLSKMTRLEDLTVYFFNHEDRDKPRVPFSLEAEAAKRVKAGDDSGQDLGSADAEFIQMVGCLGKLKRLAVHSNNSLTIRCLESLRGVETLERVYLERLRESLPPKKPQSGEPRYMLSSHSYSDLCCLCCL